MLIINIINTPRNQNNLQMEKMGHQQSDEYDDILKEVEVFEATKAGIKGLVDSGIKRVPRFCIQQSETSPKNPKNGVGLPQVPLIDLEGFEDGVRRAKIVEEIRKAAEEWGFFQIINHGVPQDVMDGILEATKRFHEQPNEAKKELYSSDPKEKVRFMTINGKFRRNHVVNWRDTLACTFLDDVLDPEAVPPVCRKEVFDYLEKMVKVRGLLAEGLSEALGLDKDFLDSVECMKSEYFLCLYYPASPEPELTFGSFRHQDATFMTAVLQDSMGGLQVLYQDNWIDVKPIHGALVINIGELMQLITNDKFKSVEHRVVSSYNGPRLSIACFFTPSSGGQKKSYGPIKELLSETNPQIYKEVPYADYINFHQIKIRERIPILPFFKVGYNNEP